MKNKLQQLFPTIKTRQAVLEEIQSTPTLLSLYQEWTAEQQEEFLAFVTGARGVKILYDSFFKEVLNPETVPHRLNDLLSQLLKKRVHILQVLPPDNSRLADESSLVIMDIVVQLDDGSIVDVEIQKIGYLFPGQRSACYSSDLLLRQYKAAREHKLTKRFSYKNLHTVYTIVFFESSPKEFHAFPNDYLHSFQQKSNTGLQLDLLQKYLFIPLDIFHKKLQNKGITNELDAWLAFLCCDDPEMIACIIDRYPEFKALYEHIYDICQNIEKVMSMFSNELKELDKNTVQLMIDEMQDTIQEQQAAIQNQQDTIQDQQQKIDQKDQLIQQLLDELDKAKKSEE